MTRSPSLIIEDVLARAGGWGGTALQATHVIDALRGAGWHLLHVELHHETDHPEPASWAYEGLDVLEFKGQLDDRMLTARGTAHPTLVAHANFDVQKMRTTELWRDFAHLIGVQLGFVEPR